MEGRHELCPGLLASANSAVTLFDELWNAVEDQHFAVGETTKRQGLLGPDSDAVLAQTSVVIGVSERRLAYCAATRARGIEVD